MDFTFSAENKTGTENDSLFSARNECEKIPFSSENETWLSLLSNSGFEHSVHLALPACCSDFVK